jgi:protein-disulfide isomerase
MITKTFVLSAMLCVAITENAAVAQSSAAHESKTKAKCSIGEVDGSVAIAAGQPISERELDDAAAAQILPLRNQEYQIRSKVLEDLIRQRLVEAEARSRGLTVDQLYAQEVDSKIPVPTQGEIAAYYLALKSQLKSPLPEIENQLRSNLKALQMRQARQDYANSLRAKADVSILLQPPKVDVTFDRASLRGDPRAAVTIVEFADYQCPYCKQAEATMDALLKKYPGQVNLAFRDFPLTSIHPYAEKASEASRCAGRQGKFWEFHDALFSNQTKLDESSLNSIAQTLALDITSFQSCLASGEYKAQISRDQDDGRKAGISSTPGFFVNGVFLNGAQGESAFEKVIENQLRAAKNQPVARASR